MELVPVFALVILLFALIGGCLDPKFGRAPLLLAIIAVILLVIERLVKHS